MADKTINLKDASPVQRQFVGARDVSVPLIVVRTADAAATVQALAAVAVTPENRPAPCVQWDAVSGFIGVNPAGTSLAVALGGDKVLNPVTALMKASAAPEHATVFMQNLSEYFRDPAVVQAFWNLRDPFKRNWRTLVATQAVGGVPARLEHDVLLIDEPLPGVEDLSRIVRGQYEAARRNSPTLPNPTDAVVSAAVDSIAGLSAFAAEQAVALSLRKSGLDMTALRTRHRQMIENTKGLTVHTGTETFLQVGGLKAFIGFATRFLKAKKYVPGAVLFIDEIEKALAGVKGDLTGISQDYLSTLLQYMQDGKIPGILLMGHPGTGKSLLAKALGNTAGVPTVRADLGAMHGSLVGESQHSLRHALKVTTAISQGRPLVVATCNSVAILPPELVNRFKWRFFVDLPDTEEKATIWPIHIASRGLTARQERPEDMDWNGREIEQCCETAYQLDCSLLEAAQYVVPVAVSSVEQIETRRREANGRYLSASKPGWFGHEPRAIEVGGRQIKLPGDEETKWVAPGTGKVN